MKKTQMKAYEIRDMFDGLFTSVVFAETAGKAKIYALKNCEFFEDCEFIDLEVHRNSQLDKYYKDGKRVMDWDNANDRLALIKDGGFEDC